MFGYKNIIKVSIYALIFSFDLRSTLAGCQDNNNYQFGTYFYGGKIITRKCAWLKSNPQKSEHRIATWCSRKYINTVIADKCQMTCGKCGVKPGVCSDISPRDKDPSLPMKWYDNGGSQYDCQWYALGKNCNVFGDASNYGYTAKQACCTCGGGVVKNRRELDSSNSDNRLRGANGEVRKK